VCIFCIFVCLFSYFVYMFCIFCFHSCVVVDISDIAIILVGNMSSGTCMREKERIVVKERVRKLGRSPDSLGVDLC
jgi:hypothetical protein